MSRAFLQALAQTSVEFRRLVHQGCLLPFDRVHVEDLVAGLDVIHHSTTARIGSGNHSVLRFHLPEKRENNLCINFKLFALRRISLSSTVCVCEWRSTQHHA